MVKVFADGVLTENRLFRLWVFVLAHFGQLLFVNLVVGVLKEQVEP